MSEEIKNLTCQEICIKLKEISINTLNTEQISYYLNMLKFGEKISSEMANLLSSRAVKGAMQPKQIMQIAELFVDNQWFSYVVLNNLLCLCSDGSLSREDFFILFNKMVSTKAVVENSQQNTQQTQESEFLFTHFFKSLFGNKKTQKEKIEISHKNLCIFFTVLKKESLMAKDFNDIFEIFCFDKNFNSEECEIILKVFLQNEREIVKIHLSDMCEGDVVIDDLVKKLSTGNEVNEQLNVDDDSVIQFPFNEEKLLVQDENKANNLNMQKEEDKEEKSQSKILHFFWWFAHVLLSFTVIGMLYTIPAMIKRSKQNTCFNPAQEADKIKVQVLNEIPSIDDNNQNSNQISVNLMPPTEIKNDLNL